MLFMIYLIRTAVISYNIYITRNNEKFKIILHTYYMLCIIYITVFHIQFAMYFYNYFILLSRINYNYLGTQLTY